MATRAISVTVEDRPGMLFKTTQVLTENEADIRYVDILHRPTHQHRRCLQMSIWAWRGATRGAKIYAPAHDDRQTPGPSPTW